MCFAFFPRAQKMVGIVIHIGEQFFEGAPDHVVAAGRARARVRGSGLKPNFQGSQAFRYLKLSFSKSNKTVKRH